MVRHYKLYTLLLGGSTVYFSRQANCEKNLSPLFITVHELLTY